VQQTYDRLRERGEAAIQAAFETVMIWAATRHARIEKKLDAIERR